MKIKLPVKVEEIITLLEARGHRAYAVGGCVRDCIIGAVPYDWDICTSALPNQVAECLCGYRIIETGLKHGTVTAVKDSEHFEVTTFRTDGEYSDNRRPDKVAFSGNLRDDLARRDFTMNALAYNPREGIVDYFRGIEDIKSKTIRCVGNAITRFSEDALRIMRALRFASVLNFAIEEQTAAAIFENRELLKNISAERISAELNKLLTGNVEVLSEYQGIIKVVLPELLENSAFAYIGNAADDVVVRLALLLSETGAEAASGILKRLKYDNDTVGNVTRIISHGETNITCESDIKRLLGAMGEDGVRRLIEYKKAKTGEDFADAISAVNEIIANKKCCSLKELAVDGKDLINVGITEGREIGNILDKLLDMVIDEKAPNDKAELLKKAQLDDKAFASGGLGVFFEKNTPKNPKKL